MEAGTETENTQAEEGVADELEELTETAHGAKAREAIEAFEEHTRGCPVKAGKRTQFSAVESYIQIAPGIKDDFGGTLVPTRNVRVTRCVECGGHIVKDPKRERYERERDDHDEEV